ncbi:MAG: hypothetical protein HYV07_15840 [Deltaproteobacteria bacterium]|nr:hypothetical protein [Deltaproteobacteria bacterium]
MWLTLAACGPNPELVIDAPGELVLVGIVDALGRVAVETGFGALKLQLAEGSRAAIWRLDPTEIVHPDGSVLSQAELEATSGSAVSSSCGCQIPRIGADTKLVASPGSACLVGRLSDLSFEAKDGELTAAPGAPAELLERARLSWPGECACDPRWVREAPKQLIPCALLPEGAPSPVIRAAIHESGRVVAMMKHSYAWFGNNGELKELPFSASDEPDFVGALEDGFILSTRNLQSVTQPATHRKLSLDGELVSELPQLGDMVVQSTFTRPGEIWIGGLSPLQIIGYSTVVHSCPAEGGPCRARMLTQREGCRWGGRSEGIASVGELDRLIFVVSPHGGLATLSATGDFECRFESAETIGDFQIDWIEDAAVFGDKLYMCASLKDTTKTCGESIGALLEVGFSSELEASVTITSTSSAACRSLTVLPGESEIVARFWDRGEVRARTGEVRRIPASGQGSIVPEAPSVFRRLSRRGDWMLAEDAHALWRAGPSGIFDRIHGMTPDAGTGLGAAPTEGGLLAFRAGSNVLRYEVTGPGCGSIESHEVAAESGLSETERPVRVFSLPESGFVMFATRPGVAGFARRGIIGDPSTFTEVELPARPIDAARLAADAWLVLGERRLFVLRIGSSGPIDPGALTELEPRFDDPRTPAIERREERLCGGAYYRAVDAREGVAWVTGHRSLIRITLSGEAGGPVAEGYWFEEIERIAHDPTSEGWPSPSAVTVRCASDVDVAVELTPDATALSPRARMFEIRGDVSRCSQATETQTPHALGALCALEDARSTLARISDVTALIPQRSGTAVVSSSGLVLRSPLNQRLLTGHTTAGAGQGPGQSMFFWHPSGMLSIAAEKP